ncbi:MAG: hypothetical protein HUN04_24780 [Desulfobacter sp.]|nr:MAG: hypothetical protein HUN04_24780 [Desulfobacter sp.]
MQFHSKQISDAFIEASSFHKNDVEELHFYVKGIKGASFDAQVGQIRSGIQSYLEEKIFPTSSVNFVRLFTSDYANQDDKLRALSETLVTDFSGCAVSIVQQPPLEGRKLVAWVYAAKDERNGMVHKEVDRENGGFVCRRGDYVHIWNTQLKSANGNPDSACQTQEIFNNFGSFLGGKKLNVKDNCIRTWLFVKDIDFNYSGVVGARTAYFEGINMTKDTHFIASTGIDGRLADPNTNVIMDAYSLGGIRPDQVKHLEAPDHLNPTHEYGVTFERGTAVDFGDRRHIYISGTASIDNRGNVVHDGDVYRQVGRAFENITALLADAAAAPSDIAQMVVYLRDVNDAGTIEQYLDEVYPDIPRVTVLAPVCRPGWLIEIECVAIKDITKPEYGNF